MVSMLAVFDSLKPEAMLEMAQQQLGELVQFGTVAALGVSGRYAGLKHTLWPVAAAMTPGLPTSFAVVGSSTTEAGERVLVGFAPRHGGDAVLAVLAVAQRLAEEEGFAGEALAVAPQWSGAARRRLAAVGELPFRFRALAASNLDEEGGAVRPELPDPASPLPPERLADACARPEEREVFDASTKCILCACCTTSCPVFWVNGRYLGPAAIVNAHRFIFDSRDRGTGQRLEALNQSNGLWRCRTAYNCTEACPRDIPITKAIEEVKRALLWRTS